MSVTVAILHLLVAVAAGSEGLGCLKRQIAGSGQSGASMPHLHQWLFVDSGEYRKC